MVALVSGYSWDKMVNSIVIIIGSFMNIIMLFIVITIKIVTHVSRKRFY